MEIYKTHQQTHHIETGTRNSNKLYDSDFMTFMTCWYQGVYFQWRTYHLCLVGIFWYKSSYGKQTVISCFDTSKERITLISVQGEAHLACDMDESCATRNLLDFRGEMMHLFWENWKKLCVAYQQIVSKESWRFSLIQGNICCVSMNRFEGNLKIFLRTDSGQHNICCYG